MRTGHAWRRLPGSLGRGLRSVSLAAASRVLAWDWRAACARAAVRGSSSLHGDAGASRQTRRVSPSREMRDQGTESVQRISILAHSKLPATS